jgi:hypothetical protein
MAQTKAEDLRMQMYNEEQLPHVTSRVERFLLDSDGNAEGMTLDNGVDVYFRPHLSAAVLNAVHVGDRITVYGRVAIATPMIAAAVIEPVGGRRIVDDELPTPQLRPTPSTRMLYPAARP